MRSEFLERHMALAMMRPCVWVRTTTSMPARSALGGRMRLVPWAGFVRAMPGNSLSLNHGRRELAALEASDDRLLASGRLSLHDVETVKQHQFTIRSRLAWIDFMGALKAAKLHDALGVLLKDFRQTPYVARGLARMVAGRFGGARKV